MKIAVVGGGAGGLAAAKCIQTVLPSSAITVFEKTPLLGGVWGLNHGASYAWPDMRTNLSKYSGTFSDFSYPKDASIFPSTHETNHYLLNYAKRFDLTKLIRKDTCVTHANFTENQAWQICSTNSNHAVSTETFDALIVASGMFSIPSLPKFKNTNKFSGHITHSGQFKQDESFANKHVVIIGNGYSAADIAARVSKTARSVTHLTKDKNPPWVIPKWIRNDDSRLKPLDLVLYKRRVAKSISIEERNIKTNRYLSRLTGQNDVDALYIDPNSKDEKKIVISDEYTSTVRAGKILIRHGQVNSFEDNFLLLNDGAMVYSDHIICCTGYRPNLDFLDRKTLEMIEYDPADKLYPVTLYESMLHPQRPGLYFIGMGAFRGPYFPIVELQSRVVAEILAGRAPYPGNDEVDKYFKKSHENKQLVNKPQFINDDYLDLIDFYAKWAGVFPSTGMLETLYGKPFIPAHFRLQGPDSNHFEAHKAMQSLNDFMQDKRMLSAVNTSSLFGKNTVQNGEISYDTTELNTKRLKPA